jgi:hypothetical protein
MAVYDVDGDGDVQVFSDCLMIVKYQLGQRGDELTNNGTLIGVGATRDTAEKIAAYLETIEWQLDVGGDGVFGYGDAQLILLYVAGLRDQNLMNKGLNSAADVRSTADEIEAYIARMVT